MIAEESTTPHVAYDEPSPMTLKPPQPRLLLTLSLVLVAHLIVVGFLLSSRQRLRRTSSDDLQWVWIPRETSLAEMSSDRKPAQRAAKRIPQHEHPPPALSISPETHEDNNAITLSPDWSEELQLAAKNAVAKELAKKKHESDFSHIFPTQPKTPERFAWDYAATHRVEAIPGGGIAVHINDNCVLVLLPLPIIGCGIGTHPANGGLFEHMHD